MFVAAAVKRHFFNLVNKIVCRRDLVDYGSQNAVDSVLSKLKAKETIFCLAPGVYLYREFGHPFPSVQEVAEARIGSLARHGQMQTDQISEEHHGQCFESNGVSARNYTLVESRPGVLIYETDGCSSSFRVHPTPDRPGAVVHLRKRAARKMYLGFTASGRAIKSAWRLGKDRIAEDDIRGKLNSFTRKEKIQFQSSHRWMPGWFSDIVHRIGSFAANGLIQKEKIRQKKYTAFTKLILIPKFNPLVLQLE
jgi:hypothetical protein